MAGVLEAAEVNKLVDGQPDSFWRNGVVIALVANKLCKEEVTSGAVLVLIIKLGTTVVTHPLLLQVVVVMFKVFVTEVVIKVYGVVDVVFGYNWLVTTGLVVVNTKVVLLVVGSTVITVGVVIPVLLLVLGLIAVVVAAVTALLVLVKTAGVSNVMDKLL